MKKRDEKLIKLLFNFAIKFNSCPRCGKDGEFYLYEYLNDLRLLLFEKNCSCKLNIDDFIDEEGEQAI